MPPFRAETIGSLLRPRSLKDMHGAIAQGRATPADYEALLEREVGRVIARQEELGFKAVSDGEFGRSSWFGFFFDGLSGLALKPSQFQFKDAEGHRFEWPTCVAVERIARRHPMVPVEFKRARKLTRHAQPKAAMPAPSAFHFFRLDGAIDGQAYASIEAYIEDLVAIERAEMRELAEAGCRYLQFDEVPIAMLCDASVRAQIEAQGKSPAAIIDLYVGAMNAIVADRPPGMTIGMHLCRGNFRGRWMAAGGYEPVAERLFARMPVDVFFLEYDSERAGGDFQPLRFVPKDKSVVLGLVSSKAAAMESIDGLRHRLDEAARIVPLERLGISPQCGFASVAGGNLLDEEQQWRKLKLVADTARAVWGTT